MIGLECPECSQPYERNNKKRTPKVLPCGHSQCADCMFESGEAKGYYSCT